MNEDLIPAFAAQRQKVGATFAPGAKYVYCNTNFYLLATIAARVAKQPFGKVLHQEILDPLKMTASFCYDHPGATVKQPVRGYVNALAYRPTKKKDQPWEVSWGSPPFRQETNLIVGDGGIWSSLDDLQKLDAALRSGTLLRKATLAAALTPSQTRDKKVNDYGLGFALSLGANGNVLGYWHNGRWQGFRTMYYRNLARGESYIILSNRDDFDVHRFFLQLALLTAGRH